MYRAWSMIYGLPCAALSAQALGDEELEADIHEILLASLPADGFAPSEPFEFVSGFIGLGLHAVHANFDGAPMVVDMALTWLETNVRMSSRGACWSLVDHIDLGLAHGQGGIVLFLAEVLAATTLDGSTRARAKTLLQPALAFTHSLLPQAPKPLMGVPFKVWLDERDSVANAIIEPAAKWCYGVFGLSMVWAKAAEALGESIWSAHALAMMQSAAQHSEYPPSSFLCHGQVGWAYLWTRWHNWHGDPVFATRAHERLQAYFNADGLAFYERGYKPFHIGDFLNGDVGIACGFAGLLRPDLRAWEALLAIPTLAR